jgi:glyoxylase-like metal-dependent hydrolase (beta-lactamase superfamily II)
MKVCFGSKASLPSMDNVQSWGQAMRSLMAMLAIIASMSVSASAQTAPDIALTRLDCGTSNAPGDVSIRFSDTYAYNGLKVQIVFSCYLIKHGDDYIVWDAGHAMSAGAVAPKVSLVDQLAQLKLTPQQIKFIAISHYHNDHVGQVGSFPDSTLLIGKRDWDVLTKNPGDLANPAPFAHWITGGGKVEPVEKDKDMFGDGTIVMLNTPGHTPGHHSLLVRLKNKGPVLLTGDLAHFRENYDGDGVPNFNADRTETLSSFDRFKKIAKNVKATVIIQHDARDVAKLPPFPAAAD